MLNPTIKKRTTRSSDKSISDDSLQYYQWEITMQVITMLMPHLVEATPVNIVKGKRQYHFRIHGTPHLYIVSEGIYHRKRRHDDRVLNTFFAPGIAGWAESESEHTQTYLERDGYGKLYTIPLSKALFLAEKNDSLRDIIILMGKYIEELDENDYNIHPRDAYVVIQNMIASFSQLPVWYQQQTTMLAYCRQRTALGKSTILRVLKKMKEEGNITMEEGRLIGTDSKLQVN